MNSRPKNWKYARNKNVIVIGGSGSGKTRYYVKPQLMQLTDHVSYVVTDPKVEVDKVKVESTSFRHDKEVFEKHVLSTLFFC